MSNPIVYLAGPIAGCTYKEAFAWRVNAKRQLQAFGIDSLSPMRQKKALADLVNIGADFRAYEDNGPFYTSHGIMQRDMTDVRRSDVLLVNLLGAVGPSFGTSMELAWAYWAQKPVVVAIEPKGNLHDNHPMLKEAMGALRFPTLEEAIHGAAIVLGLG